MLGGSSFSAGVGYANALDLQKELESVTAERKRTICPSSNTRIHKDSRPPSSKGDGVLATAEMLSQMGVETFEINRGGRVTYHLAPAKLVGIIRSSAFRPIVRMFTAMFVRSRKC
ncbi:MAG: hypothetical protein IPO41_16665, partial [Acidobacteria bacterium]|nr:hypothetical protein [Acidobacteriota bacterium]